jgi:Mg2+/Co2+ transporter CorB
MDPASLGIFFILLFLLVFFAGTEIPLMSISDHIIVSAVKRRRFGAVTLQSIKAQNERLLMTNLVGTTAVTIAISSFSTIVALDASRQVSLP